MFWPRQTCGIASLRPWLRFCFRVSTTLLARLCTQTTALGNQTTQASTFEVPLKSRGAAQAPLYKLRGQTSYEYPHGSSSNNGVACDSQGLYRGTSPVKPCVQLLCKGCRKLLVDPPSTTFHPVFRVATTGPNAIPLTRRPKHQGPYLAFQKGGDSNEEHHGQLR